MNRLCWLPQLAVVVTLSVIVTSCGSAPQIHILAPAAGGVVQAETDVKMRVVGDAETLGSIVVTAGGFPVGTVARGDLFADVISVAWDPSALPPGSVTLHAVGKDLAGNDIVRASVDVTVHRGLKLPVGEGEGEGAAEGEGEGEGAAEGEGEGEGIGEGEGEGASSGFVSPPARSFSRVADFPANSAGDASAPNPGNLNMYLYVPAHLPEHAPVVVALHGCSQNATQYMTATGWTTLAERFKFIVIFPEQNAEHASAQTGNPVSCFNWAGYYGAKMGRGEGENQSIKEMVDVVTQSDVYRADPSRVYVTGLSAGGAMTALLLATWPDVFAAGAPMAGVPYACASDVNGATACMHGDAARDAPAATWGDRVRAAAPAGYDGPWPRVQIWQGDADNTVSFKNTAELVKQWTNVHGTDQTVDDSSPLKPNAPKHARAAYAKDGVAVVETVTLHGMDHGIAVDPGSEPDQGGTAGLYAYSEGIHSSYYAARFFGIVDDSPPTSGEGEGEGEGEGAGADCVEFSSTVMLHLYALPPRVANTGTLVAPSYSVIGSGEAIPASVNPYLDAVLLHSTSSGFALGGC